MNRRTVYLFIAICCLTGDLHAQSANPFDLQWKALTSADSLAGVANPSTDSSTPVAEIEAEPEEPIVPVPPPVTIEPPAQQAANTDSLAKQDADSITNPFDLRTDEDAVITESIPPATKSPDPPDSESPPREEKDSDNEMSTGVTTPPGAEDPGDEEQGEVVSNLVLFLLFGLVLLVLTWAVNINRGFLRKIYRAVLNENFSSLLLREHRFASNQYLYYLVYVTFFINGGMFLYFLSRYTTWADHFSSAPLMLFIAFAAAVYLIRHLGLAILGGTFPVSRELKHFSFNILLFNILLGIFLIPVNLFLSFGHSGLYGAAITVGLIAIGLVYLIRQFRGLVIAGGLIGSNMFHFFVYLCTVEVLPVLVLFKLLITD